MSIKVEVRDDESIDSALRRFNELVQGEVSRTWCKRRYGYYEKPSELRRKRKKMAWLRSGSQGNLLLRIGLKELYSRTGPKNAAGR
jgi:ribosomal protein S21